MRGAIPLLLASLVFAGTAAGAPPAVIAGADTLTGPAPLRVTLNASGDAQSYRWELPGGATADGAAISHTFPAGRHVVAVVGTAANGETTRVTLTVTSLGLTLSGPRSGLFRGRTTFRGRLVPALAGVRVELARDGVVVATGRVRKGGAFRIGVRPRGPATYEARFGGARSGARTLSVRPRLRISLPRSLAVGGRLPLRATVQPPRAGTLHVRIWRAGKRLDYAERGRPLRIRLDSRRPARYRVKAWVVPVPGFTRVARTTQANVYFPSLATGARGPSVAMLERRLADLGFALPRVDRLYAWDTYEAVVAFQKLHGLPRTGRTDRRVWRELRSAHRPRPRYLAGSHIEVDKGRQLLFLVRGGRVRLVSHVSTGATGNTPVGRWHVYRKVAGWDWILWYPMYFLRGFAIHGYPSVPPFPASHGCVRVPMWLAPQLFAGNPYGTTIYVY